MSSNDLPRWVRLPNDAILNISHIVSIQPNLVEMPDRRGTTYLNITCMDIHGDCHDLNPLTRWDGADYEDGCDVEYCLGLTKMFAMMQPGQIIRTWNYGDYRDYIEGYPAVWAAVIEEQ